MKSSVSLRTTYRSILRSTELLSTTSRVEREGSRAFSMRASSSRAAVQNGVMGVEGGYGGLRRVERSTGARGGYGGRIEGKRGYKTVQEQRSRYRSGPFSAFAGLLFLSSGAALILYFRHEKDRMERKRITEAAKGVGRPKVGGPFSLISHTGSPFTEQNMKGRYSLVYFGFSHCPDICPEELDKMAEIIDLVSKSDVMGSFAEKSLKSGDEEVTMEEKKQLLPIFITCDPARDTPAVLKEYLSEFHPAIIGLTGTWENIKDVCKKYRVYFSTPENVKPGSDYLVDHSIYFYLMDPEGDFVEAIGRQHSPGQAARVILEHVGDWGR